MKVEVHKTFKIEAPAQVGWDFTRDVSSVTACMPGAAITETIDERNYKGTVKVKLGPAALSFNGTIEIENIDDEKRSIHLIGRGQDKGGVSSAEMDLTAQINEIDDDSFELLGSSIVTVTGRAATFGGRIMGQVADKVLDQFGANFSKKVVARSKVGSSDNAADSESVQEDAQEPAAALDSVSIIKAVASGFFKRGGKK